MYDRRQCMSKDILFCSAPSPNNTCQNCRISCFVLCILERNFSITLHLAVFFLGGNRFPFNGHLDLASAFSHLLRLMVVHQCRRNPVSVKRS